MSHLSKIELEITDLASLKEACQTLGLEFRPHQKSFRWYSGTTSCDHAIHVPGADYEIGVTRTPQNHYDLLWDNYSNGGLTDKIGVNAGRFKQAYAVARIIREAQQKKYRVIQQTVENGIQLVLS